MPKFDSRSSTPIQLIANEILKIMHHSRGPLEGRHVIGAPMPDDLKIRLRWTAKWLFADLQSGQDVSLHMVGEALKMLHGENYITLRAGMHSGFELTEKGRTEAERLAVKPS
jgi:hypothetical protein